MNPAAIPGAAAGTIRLEIPAEAQWVAVARLAVAAVAHRLPFTVDELDDIKLAVGEAVTNAIQRDGVVRIDLTCAIAGGILTVTVRDGVGMPRLEAVGDERIGELGRSEELANTLIRALMDTLEIGSDPRTGSELVMTKRVSR